MPSSHDSLPGTWDATLTPAIFASQRSVTAPQPSPDGRRIAFQSEYDGRNDLFVVEPDSHPIQVTADQSLPGHGVHYAWSPDGEQFVFTSAADGKLWLGPARGGPPRRLTTDEGQHRLPRFSPDGRFVSFLRDRGPSVEVAVVAADGTSQRIISRGTDFPMDPSWSPDGTRLLWHAYPWNYMPWDESALVVADLAGGEPRTIAAGPRVAYANGRFSPDGHRIVCLCDRAGALNVMEMAADGTGQRLLHEDRWEHGEPTYAPDGRTIAYTRNVAGDYQIWTVPSGGDNPRQLTTAPGHAVALAWLPDVRRLVYTFDSPVTPPDVWSVDIATGESRQLTFSAMGGIDAANLVMPEHVTWTSSGGFEVHGLLYAPKTLVPGQHGCLVNIHGGPMNQSRVVWDGLVQYLVQRGWVVIHSNYRGTLGFGRAYREALFGSWGEGDLADNIGAIDFCLARGLIRPDRAVAWGGSAGGYSTLVCVSKAPQRFAGGVALYGLYDLYTFGLETHRYERYYVETILGPSSEKYALWHERSPINHLANIRAPLLIAQGEADRVVWQEQSETVNRELDRLSVDYEYVCYPGEGHGFRRVSTKIDFARRMDRYLCQKVLRAPEAGPLGPLPYPPMQLPPSAARGDAR